MKKERKLLALLLVFCMVFALAACGNKDMSDADVMKQATENMNALKSMTAETSMEMVFSMGEDSMTMTSMTRWRSTPEQRPGMAKTDTTSTTSCTTTRLTH